MKVIAYHVTARRAADPRGFRRCGRWFPVGEPVRVPLDEISVEQAAHLKGSNPRDLIVVDEFEKPAVQAVPVVAQVDEVDTAPATPAAKKGRGK